MYINFMDILRDIQNGIYPQVKQWRDEAEIIRDEITVLNTDANRIYDDTVTASKNSEASKRNSEAWADTDEYVPVTNTYWDENNHYFVENVINPEKFSAKHWAGQSQHLAEVEKWKAQAAQMTACSFSNQAPNEPVKVYTSNGDGTFTESEVEYVFSALHYRNDTETLTGHKRWIESQVAVQDQLIFGFQKNINHADVYKDGIRQIEGVDYTRLLKDVTFTSPLDAGQTVTVSGMEACTGSEFHTLAEQTKVLRDDAQRVAWEAEASEMTAESFVSEPVDVFVKIFTSNGDGTFSSVTTPYYSALHWSVRMNITMSHLVVVDTYHDLELVNVNEAKTVYVRGGLTVGDGKQGLFYYDASQSAINNQGTIIDGWVREYNDAMNIMWFPVIGDGTVDDTAAINNALQWDRVIFIPEGNYHITDTIMFSGHRVIADKAIFYAYQQSGIAVSLQNMRLNEGVYGDLRVKWIDTDMTQSKVSFYIDNSIGAEFSISSDGATRGIEISPNVNFVRRNIFKLKEFKNNTIGLYVNGMTNGFTVKENIFIGGIMQQDATVQGADLDSSIASFIYVRDNTAVDNKFKGQSFEVDHNDNYMLFRVFGKDTYIEPLYASISNVSNIYGFIGGEDNVLNALTTSNLKAYIRPELGYASTIDISGATGFKMIGNSNVTKLDENTNEVETNGTKASQTIENKGTGAASYYPTTDANKTAIDIFDEANIRTAFSPRSAIRTDGSSNISTVTSAYLELSNSLGGNTAILNRNQIRLFDDAANANHNEITKLGLDIYDDTDTLSLTKVSALFTKSGNAISTAIGLLGLSVKDGTDAEAKNEIDGAELNRTSTNQLASYKIDGTSVKSGLDESRVEKDKVTVTDGTDTTTILAGSVSTEDVVATNLTTDSLTVSDGTNTVHVVPTQISSTDGTDTTTVSPTEVLVKNISTENIIVTDGTDTTTVSPAIVTSKAATITDGTDSTTVLPTGVNTGTVNSSEVNVASGSDSIKLTPVKMELDDGNGTTINTIVWRGTDPGATTNGVVGDIIYNSTPTAGGKLGWVCVTTGAPATWKAFGAIDA